jgi:hypothetical protein
MIRTYPAYCTVPPSWLQSKLDQNRPYMALVVSLYKATCLGRSLASHHRHQLGLRHCVLPRPRLQRQQRRALPKGSLTTRTNLSPRKLFVNQRTSFPSCRPRCLHVTQHLVRNIILSCRLPCTYTTHFGDSNPSGTLNKVGR